MAARKKHIDATIFIGGTEQVLPVEMTEAELLAIIAVAVSRRDENGKTTIIIYGD